MAVTLICPRCQARGSLPDAFAGGRVSCPRCGMNFAVPGPSPVVSAGPPRMFVRDDCEHVPQNVVIPPTRIQPAHVRARRAGLSPLVLAGFGMGGTIILLLIALIVLMLTRQESHLPAPAPVLAQQSAEPAPLSPAAPVAVPALAPQPAPEPPPSPPPAVIPTFQPISPSPPVDHLAMVKRLEDATVYIKVRAGRKGGSGTGFVVRRVGETVLVATNRHVVTLQERAGPGRSLAPGNGIGSGGGPPEITVVFRSGQGAGAEQSHRAEVVAIDESEEITHDLAILQVRDVKNPPMPIDPPARVDLIETMRYTGYGFPFGDITKGVGVMGNPSVTVTSGTISALRRDQNGHLVAIQLDGSLQPGNSGGPLVDEKGKLIGIAVAKMAATDTIGLAIPAPELAEVLEGRIGAVNLILHKSAPGTADLQVKAQIVDPLHKVRDVEVAIVPTIAALGFGPCSDGAWTALPGAMPSPLVIDGTQANGRVQVALSGQGPDARNILLQTSFRTTSGKLIHSAPRLVHLPEATGPIVPGDRLLALELALARSSMAKLGPLIDPDKGCTLVKNEQNMKIEMSLPGRLLTLSPMMKRRGLPIHNAPMSLIDVEGDFLITVRVTGNMGPGKGTLKDPTSGKPLPFAFQGAGLIVYQDRTNFLRLERACQAEGTTEARELLVEVVRSGHVADHQYIHLEGSPSAPIHLLVLRRQDKVRCLFSPDGHTMIGFKNFEHSFPGKVRVGLTASNISHRPLEADFQDFVLFDDKAKIAEEFGAEK